MTIFALPLMFAGGSLVGGIAEQSVGGVGDLEIPYYEFLNVYQQVQENIRRQYGFDALPPDAAELARQQAQSRLVSDYLIRAAATDKQIYAPSEAVAAEIRANPEFQDESGEFNISLFQSYVADFRLAEEEVRQEMQSKALLNALAPHPMPAVREKLAAYRGQQRIIEEAAAPVTAAFNISDEDIARYYSQNQRGYLIPEETDWEYVEIFSSSFMDVAPDDETLSIAFEELVEERESTEEREAAHIFVESGAGAEEEAESLFQRAAADPDAFGDLAQEFSADAGSAIDGGYLGPIVRGDLPEEMEAALFAMTVGGVSAPVATEGGYSILKLIAAGSPPPDKEAMADEIDERARLIMGRDRLLEEAERLQEIAEVEIGSLEGVAEAASLTLQTLLSVARPLPPEAPGFFSNPETAGLLYNSEVLRRGENSSAIAVTDDHYIFARAARHRPRSVRPLPEVSEEIASLLNARNQIDQMREDDAPLPSGLSWNEPATIGLRLEIGEEESPYGEEVINEIFQADLSGGLPALAMVAEPGTVRIFRIQEILNPPPAIDDESAIDDILDTAGSAAGTTAYLEFLSENYDVYFNEQARTTGAYGQ